QGERELAWLNLRDRFDAGGRAEHERGMHGTRGVCGPVADLAGTEIPKAPPVVRNVVVAEGTHRRAAEPEVPVQGGRHAVLRRDLLQSGRMSAGRSGHVRFQHVTDGAAPHDLRGDAVALVGEALVAHLRRDLVFDRGLLKETRFPDRAGERLLYVNVL